MDGFEYQRLAMRTNDGNSTPRLFKMIDYYGHNLEIDMGGILNGCLGLSGEVGEFNDMIKKWVFHDNNLDYDHARKEIGDILWYIALICHSFGWDMNKIMQMNINKLKARYPDGFDVELSAHRKEGDV